MIQKILKMCFFILFASFSFAQTKDDIPKIIKKYDIEKIKTRSVFFEKLEKQEKEEAIKVAKIEGWPIIVEKVDGTFEELMKLTPDGYPVYYSTTNVNAAKSTRANHLNSGGSLGLNLNGQGMVARVWDGGTVRRTHSLFENRVITVDDATGTTYSPHATHVTGTVIASDASATAKGMAFQATARTFNWTNDESEAANEALGGMLISNHSYGIPVTSSTGTVQPAWYIGAYTSGSRNWDEIAYLAPYFLPVMSAGNEGNNNDNANPIAFGFDKLTGDKTSKNSLIVANGRDANVSVDGTLISVQINSSSSQGPTDDRRIKPDITGNGTALTSTDSSSDIATSSRTGTSMASPNVAGTLLLLQQHNRNITNNFLKAATLKGLACHTADDAGNVGPDANFGWGLLNAKKAAEVLTNNGLDSWVSEENLLQGQTFSKTVISDGVNPLIASITWTDLPGEVNNGNRPDNDPTPALVNNLDIKITKDGVIYYPWKLQNNPNDLAIRSEDNDVDNVEQIKIDAPVAGEYQITITHKGNLVNNNQDFSLVITGISSNFSLISKSDDLTVCDNSDAVYLFDYKQNGTGTTMFSAVDLPNGAIATFNPASLSTNGVVTMTISGLVNVVPDEYRIGVLGDNGFETEARYKTLEIYSAVFQPIVLNSPSNSQNTLAPSLVLEWEGNNNAESYNLEVSTSSNFATLLVNEVVSVTNYLLEGLNEETTYYWRVIPSNRCGIGSNTNANVFNFKTGKLICGFSFIANDFSDAVIATVANSSASVPIEVTGGLLIGDINVDLDISHTYVQDATYYLEGPASIGSPVITLFSQPCGSGNDINCTLDDSGTDLTCNQSAPTITGIVRPYETLSELNGLSADGTWILRVEDPFNGDGGSINGVTLSFCNLEESLNIRKNILSDINIYPNPAKNSINVDLNNSLEGETNFALYDIQGRLMLKNKSFDINIILSVETLIDGVYFLTLENGDNKTTRKIIIKK
ncbi:S8 family serine peptidase [Flavobacterium sp. 316]|uniref:S8 family serine peptidase n=1 Tax=Flavobacterium sp. 316 TaxID=1603293 RepID=UPI00069836E1|nr:S8 family serine peptidase [Flavobacterium sp. 316]